MEEDSTMQKLRPEVEHNIEQYLMRCNLSSCDAATLVYLQLLVCISLTAACPSGPGLAHAAKVRSEFEGQKVHQSQIASVPMHMQAGA